MSGLESWAATVTWVRARSFGTSAGPSLASTRVGLEEGW